MENKFVVIATFIVPDKAPGTFTRKRIVETYDCFNDALEGIKTFDYPFDKLSIHFVMH